MGGPRTIVGVRVTNIGSDLGSLVPMVAQVAQRTGALPGAVVADTSHAGHEEIRARMACGVRRPAVDRSAPIAAWWALMDGEEKIGRAHV